jgi:hypothetical protein
MLKSYKDKNYNSIVDLYDVWIIKRIQLSAESDYLFLYLPEGIIINIIARRNFAWLVSFNEERIIRLRYYN